MHHLQHFIDVIRRHHARADVLLRAGHAGIDGIDVEIVPRHHVARRDRPLEVMDVVAEVDDAGSVVEVGQHRLAVAARFGLDDVHRRSRRAEIDLFAPGLHVVLGIAAIEREVPRAIGQHILDEPARNAQASLGVHETAASRHELDAGGDRLAKSHRFQKVESRGMDALELPL